MKKVNLSAEGYPYLELYENGELENTRTGQHYMRKKYFYVKTPDGKQKRLVSSILIRRYFYSELMRIPPDYVVNLRFLGYPEYSVTIDGRLWTHIYECWMSLTRDKAGYISVKLTHNKEAKSFKLHRLVAMAFVPNPFHYDQVIHVDGDINNNMAHNLKWVSAAENAAISKQRGSRPNMLSDEVAEMACRLMMDGHGDTYIASKCGTTASAIRHIRNGESHQRIAARYGITAKKIPHKLHRYYIPKPDLPK